MTDEAKAIARRRGKWSQKDVPHLGWACVDEYDAKENGGELIICEMCETMEVRFVHVMENERYPETLNCGCICAAHMSGELKAAQDRDRRMRSRAQRRANFPKRKAWRLSVHGNPCIEVHGNQFVIVTTADGRYQIRARGPHDKRYIRGPRRYASFVEAQKACFDALEFLESEQQKRAQAARQTLLRSVLWT